MDIRGFFGKRPAAPDGPAPSPKRVEVSQAHPVVLSPSPKRASEAAPAVPKAPPASDKEPPKKQLIPTGTVALGTEQWPDKYRPKSLREVVGNGMVVQKIVAWLKSWKDVHIHKKPPPDILKEGGRGQGAGAAGRAALLSGSPGIGKTTTALLACKEVGLMPVEFNASDTRSKGALHDRVAQLVQSRTLSSVGSGQSLVCFGMFCIVKG